MPENETRAESRARAQVRFKPYMPASRARVHFTRARLLELFDYNPSTGDLIVLATGDVVSGVNNCGYRWVWIDGAALLVHRIAWRVMTGEWPEGMVDHIDGNRQHNAWTNLRATDHSRNAQNMHRAMATSSTGLLGAHIGDRRHGKPFRAAIEVNGKKQTIGSFDTPQEAHEAYLKVKATLHPTASLTWSKP